MFKPALDLYRWTKSSRQPCDSLTSVFRRTGLSLLLATALVSTAPYASAETPMNGHWIWGAVEGGGAFLTSNLIDESDKNGYHFGVKALYSHYWDSFVIDAGAGWMYNDLSGTLNVGGLDIEDTTTTQAALLELAPRYRLTKAIELGLQAQAYTGTDTRFATTGDQFTTFTLLGGPQLVVNFSPMDLPIRASLSGLTDINVEDRQVYAILAGLHVGLQLSKPSRTASPVAVAPLFTPEPPPPPPTPEPLPSPTPQPVLAPAPLVYAEAKDIPRKPVPDLVVSFDLDSIYFEFDKADINEKSRRMLREIAEFIMAHNDSWNVLDIAGHTDSRGSEDYNQRLSERRASRVMRTLTLYGVPKNKIMAVGKGESSPVEQGENEVAWAKNRRVELIFDTVKDVNLFRTEIERIRNKYGKPTIFPYSKKPGYSKK